MSKKLSAVLRYALIVPLLIVILNSIRFLRFGAHTLNNTGYGVQALVGAVIVVIIGICVVFLKPLKTSHKLTFILISAFAIRLIWIISVPSVPVSDYDTMYHTAKEVAVGDFSGMKGISYFARYPHLTTSVMYMSVMHIIFGVYDLSAMKAVSLILSVVNVFLVYKISKYFVKGDKIRLFSALFASIFPPFITYVSTFCTENIAMPFLLVFVLYFSKIINGEATKKNVIMCAIMLGISNLFRGVGAIFVVAMFIAMCLCTVKYRFRIICATIAIMMSVTVIVSVPLYATGVIENHLWDGKESGITYFLKGLNVESKGAWSKEDAEFVRENFLDEDFNEQCLAIIGNRLREKTPKELSRFFFDKFINQWSYADYNGSYWAFMKTDIQYRYPIDFTSQLIGCVLLVLSLISLLKRKCKTPVLLHLCLCGFGLFFLVFETQPRYSYIVSWVFLFMAAQGLETSCELIGRLKCLEK